MTQLDLTGLIEQEFARSQIDERTRAIVDLFWICSVELSPVLCEQIAALEHRLEEQGMEARWAVV